MRRREFITLLGGAAAWPVAAHAQQSAYPIVGCIFSGPLEANGDHVAALRRGMNEAGFVEGRDVSVEYRWNCDYYDQDRYAELAADLISRRVAVIFTNTAGAALRVKAAAAAAAIPIIFVALADAVQVGRQVTDEVTSPGSTAWSPNREQSASGSYMNYCPKRFASALAFFDIRDGRGATLSSDMPKWVHHFAFEVDTIDEVRAIKERLEKAGIEVLGVTDHHFIQSIYFFDPNGLRLEVTTRTETKEYMNDAKLKVFEDRQFLAGNT